MIFHFSHLCSNLTKDGKVEAGSLILARDTICYLGEMVKFKKAELDTIKTGNISDGLLVWIFAKLFFLSFST